jgi:hypothetical protein
MILGPLPAFLLALTVIILAAPFLARHLKKNKPAAE